MPFLCNIVLLNLCVHSMLIFSDSKACNICIDNLDIDCFFRVITSAILFGCNFIMLIWYDIQKMYQEFWCVDVAINFCDMLIVHYYLFIYVYAINVQYYARNKKAGNSKHISNILLECPGSCIIVFSRVLVCDGKSTSSKGNWWIFRSRGTKQSICYKLAV